MPSGPKTRFERTIGPQLEPLRRMALRLCRNGADAEDLVQEVCLRAFQHRSELEALASPRAWLMRVQYNLHIDAYRRQKSDKVESIHDCPAEAAAGSNAPELDADTALAIEALDRVWPELNRDQQALLALYAEGYTLAEITAMTDLPLSALKARLHRARARLGNLLKNDMQPPKATASGDTK